MIHLTPSRTTCSLNVVNHSEVQGINGTSPSCRRMIAPVIIDIGDRYRHGIRSGMGVPRENET